MVLVSHRMEHCDLKARRDTHLRLRWHEVGVGDTEVEAWSRQIKGTTWKHLTIKWEIYISISQPAWPAGPPVEQNVCRRMNIFCLVNSFLSKWETQLQDVYILRENDRERHLIAQGYNGTDGWQRRDTDNSVTKRNSAQLWRYPGSYCVKLDR